MIRRSGFVQVRKGTTIRVARGKTHKAYTYRRKPSIVYVRPTMVVNRGLPGKGPKLIPVTRPGMLSAFGYSPSKSALARHRALAAAMRRGHQTPLSVSHRLQAIATLTKRTLPSVSRVYKADRMYVSKKYL